MPEESSPVRKSWLVETRSIDTTIARLREKMGKRNSAVIRTLRGRGYVWEDGA